MRQAINDHGSTLTADAFLCFRPPVCAKVAPRNELGKTHSYYKYQSTIWIKWHPLRKKILCLFAGFVHRWVCSAFFFTWRWNPFLFAIISLLFFYHKSKGELHVFNIHFQIASSELFGGLIIISPWLEGVDFGNLHTTQIHKIFNRNNSVVHELNKVNQLSDTWRRQSFTSLDGKQVVPCSWQCSPYARASVNAKTNSKKP